MPKVAANPHMRLAQIKSTSDLALPSDKHIFSSWDSAWSQTHFLCLIELTFIMQKLAFKELDFISEHASKINFCLVVWIKK